VEQGATIVADAITNGNGGQVAVWSDGTTVFNGSISAQGGSQGGNGGFIETSGKGTLIVGPTAVVSAAAPNGTAGQWLLDPTDIEISGTKADAHITSGPVFQDDGTSSGTSVLSTSTLNTALSTTNVTVTTASTKTAPLGGTITVDADAQRR